MPLRDHFNPPLVAQRHWHSFHNAWAANLVADLNHKLPEYYFAEANVQFGIEIDVATFKTTATSGFQPSGVTDWQPAEPSQTIDLPTLDELVEVNIYNSEGGPTLVAAIELVSPANKDRLSHRDAFVAKCSSYLYQGLGLVVVDVVTNRHKDSHGRPVGVRIPDNTDLHRLLLQRLTGAPEPESESPLYGSAYRPIERHGQKKGRQYSLDVWRVDLEIGQPMPVLPLWMRGDVCLPVELEATYQQTCEEQRIPA